jgi:ABC-type lipoprotein release transport system permease subunit
MLYEGFAIVLIGALLSPRAGRSMTNVNGLDQPSAAQMTYHDLEVNRLEQEIERQDTSYYNNFFYSMKTGANNLSFIITGAILLLFALNYLS